MEKITVVLPDLTSPEFKKELAKTFVEKINDAYEKESKED